MVEEQELPFGNESIRFVTRREISSDKLRELCYESAVDGVSVCVQTDDGPPERGGYLFHYQEVDGGIRLVYFPFNVEDQTMFKNWDEFNRFVRHTTGSEWDEEMFERSLQIVTRIE